MHTHAHNIIEKKIIKKREFLKLKKKKSHRPMLCSNEHNSDFYHFQILAFEAYVNNK